MRASSCEFSMSIYIEEMRGWWGKGIFDRFLYSYTSTVFHSNLSARCFNSWTLKLWEDKSSLLAGTGGTEALQADICCLCWLGAQGERSDLSSLIHTFPFPLLFYASPCAYSPTSSLLHSQDIHRYTTFHFSTSLSFYRTGCRGIREETLRGLRRRLIISFAFLSFGDVPIWHIR